MKFTLTGLFIGIFCLYPAAQSGKDSLWLVWQNTGLEDNIRLGAANALSKILIRKAPDTAMTIAQSAVQLAQKVQNKGAEAEAWTQIGMSYRLRSNFQQALKAYEQSISLLKELDNKTALAEVYRYLGDVYRLQSNFPRSVEYIQQSLELAESVGDQLKVADAYVCFSTIYYMSSDNLDQVESWLLKAKPIYEAHGSEEGLTYVYSNLSLIDYENKNYLQALEYIQKCIAIQKKNKDEFGLATSLQNRATIYTELGRHTEAQADFEKEIEIFKKIGDQEGLSDAYSSLGYFFLDLDKPAKAVLWCKKSLESALTLGGHNLSEQNACKCLYEAYARQKDHQNAFRYLERFASIRDSLQRQQTEQQLKQIELERDSLGRAAMELEKIRSYDLEINRKNRTVGILAAFLLLGLFIVWAFWTRMLYFKRKSLNMQIRSDSMEKQQLLNEIALLKSQVNPHFLFNSLSILSSLVHKNAELSEQFIEQLARSYRYILEQKDQVLVSLNTELEFIQSYAFLLKIRFEQKFDLDIDIPVEFQDRTLIAPLTLQLLVENAVKHNRMSIKEPLIIRVKIRENFLEVRNTLRPRGEQVNSTGIGLQNIVNRYALLTEQAVWAGESEGDFLVKVPLIPAGP